MDFGRRTDYDYAAQIVILFRGGTVRNPVPADDNHDDSDSTDCNNGW